MWARVVEIMLGCWLLLSPFIFHHPVDPKFYWINDLASGFAVIVIALASFWQPLGRAHFIVSGIALWLIGFGWFASAHPAPPVFQNDITVGLLLLMFSIIPNEANRPPRAWRDYYSGKTESESASKD